MVGLVLDNVLQQEVQEEASSYEDAVHVGDQDLIVAVRHVEDCDRLKDRLAFVQPVAVFRVGSPREVDWYHYQVHDRDHSEESSRVSEPDDVQSNISAADLLQLLVVDLPEQLDPLEDVARRVGPVDDLLVKVDLSVDLFEYLLFDVRQQMLLFLTEKCPLHAWIRSLLL